MALQKVKDSMRTTTAVDGTKISGAIPLGSLGNAPDPDLTPVRLDISTLALKEAIIENHVAYNLPNSFVDIFEDSTGVNAATSGTLKGLTDVAVNNVGEYASSVEVTTVANTWTFEYFYRTDDTTNDDMHWDLRNNNGTKGMAFYHDSGNTWRCWMGHAGGTGTVFTVSNASNVLWDPGAFGHFAITRHTDKVIRFYFEYGSNIIMQGTTSTVPLNPEDGQRRLLMGAYNDGGAAKTPLSAWSLAGRIDEVRLSNIARYTHTSGSVPAITSEFANDANTVGLWHIDAAGTDSSGNGNTMSFVGSHGGATDYKKFGSYSAYYVVNDYTWVGPQNMWDMADERSETVISATGTLVSTVQTAAAAKTKLSGVLLYTDNAGTSTPGTDLKIYFSANNGTNWTEAASYSTATTFSGNIKLVRLGETTVTSGTQIVMKAVWAGQSAGKEARLNGWAVNY